MEAVDRLRTDRCGENMPVILILLGVVGVAAIVYAVAESSRRWKEALMQVANTFDLSYSPGSFFSGSSAQGGTLQGDLRVDSVTEGSGENSTTYTRITLSAGLSTSLRFEKEGSWSGFKKMFTGEDHEVGDSTFDEALVVKGKPSHLTALLNISTRRALYDAVGGDGIVVKDGQIQFKKAGLIRDASKLVALTRAMLNLARGLKVSATEVPTRLFDTATRDPEPIVRRNAAALLWGRYGDTTEAVSLVAQALTSRDPSLRMMAAGRSAPDVAGPILSAIATDGAALGSLRVEAVDTIERRGLTATYGPELVSLVPRASGALLATVLAVLGRASHPVPIAILRRRVGGVSSAGRVSIARSLGDQGRAAADTLVGLLADEASDVQTAAATALGAVGDLSAVEPLLPLTQGVFANGDLKRAARAAVEAIQERQGTGPAGGLALADEIDTGGALSDTDGYGHGNVGALSAEAVQESLKQERPVPLPVVEVEPA